LTGTPRVVARLDGFLTGPSSRRPAARVLDYVRAHESLFRLDADDLAQLRLARRYTSGGKLVHLTWQQTYRGIPAFDNGLEANVTTDGRIVNVLGSPRPDLAVPSIVPRVSARAALAAAIRDAGGAKTIGRARAVRGPERVTTFRDGDQAQLVLFGTAGKVVLAWRVLFTAAPAGVFQSVVDARNGRVLSRQSLVSHANALVFDYYPGAPNGGAQRSVDITPYLTSTTSLDGPAVHAYLNVDGASGGEGEGRISELPEPDEEVPPSSGADYNYAYTAFNPVANSECAPAPAFCSWDFNVPFSWQTNLRQATTQAFYFANHFDDHLVASPIEFTTAKGHRKLEVQVAVGANRDGSGLPSLANRNNAFAFQRLPSLDPVIELLLRQPDPDRAFPAWSTHSANDAVTAYHEQTHTMSSRIVADATGMDALKSLQAEALGEGWSDWYALDLLVSEGRLADTAADGDVRVDAGTATAPLIRSQGLDCPVGSTAAACPGLGPADPGGYTYGEIGRVRTPVERALGLDRPDEHSAGEVWGQTLWDLRRRMIADHPVGTQGVKRAELLVTRAMELSPDDPTFLDVRNAMLQADTAFNAGADRAAIWAVFANRGMGYFASTLGAHDVRPIESFSLPPPPGYPTGTLTGRVLSDDGHPVPGAQVSFGGHGSGFPSDLRATADGSGNYTIAGIPVGTYPQVLVRGSVGPEPNAENVFPDVAVAAGANARDFVLSRNWAAPLSGGQIAASDGEVTACAPERAIDRDAGTTWQTSSPSYAPDAGPEFITVELALPVDVVAFAIDPTAQGCDETFVEQLEASLGQFRLETSQDGATFTQAATGTFTTSDLHRMNRVEPTGATGQGVRFVRLTGLSTLKPTGDLGARFLEVAELAVFGSADDASAPAVSLATPANGSSTTDTTPTYSGGAGNAAGDSPSVTVKVYAGSSPSGPPAQTHVAERTGTSWAIAGSPPLAPGTYTAQAEQSDAAGNTGVSSPSTFTIVASAFRLEPPFDASYAIDEIGRPPGVPPRLGGLTLKAGTTDRLLIGGSANEDVGALYEVGLIRDASGHISGFSGTATRFADAAYNDGGVAYGPGGVLFLARYDGFGEAALGQTKPGSSSTDKLIDLEALGVAHSPGAVQFVPDGLPGAGRLKLSSWPGGQWYDAAVAPDGNGTYNLLNVSRVDDSTLGGGPEGVAYVNPESPQFSAPSMLVTEFSARNVAAYELDADGNPVTATRRPFITGLNGALGAFIDPATGDFVFSTFEAGAGTVIVVRGFAPTLATLRVVKQVANDSGGTKVAGDFNVHVKTGGTEVSGSPRAGSTSGTSYQLAAGTYTVSEDAVTGYAGTFSGDCNASGQVTLAPGETKTCTITNDDSPPSAQPTLRVVKEVVNDDGGTRSAADFSVHVKASGVDVSGSPQPGSGSGTTYSLDAGIYAVSEDAAPGYAASFGGGCNASGQVALAPGETKTCTITNDDIAPSLTVIKQVVNDHGGSAVTGAWTMHIRSGGVDAPGSPFPGAPAPGATRALRAGSYVVGESGGPPGYQMTISGDCNAAGQVTLALAENKTCTVTNDDIAPTLTVIKQVVNDNGGTALPGAWTMHVRSGGVDVPGSPFPGAAAPGVTRTLRAGSYVVAESGGPAGYLASFSGDCNASGQISVALAETKTCTVTNNDVAAPDDDLDEFSLGADNCPNTYNPEQLDHDGDGVGTTCDSTPGVPGNHSYVIVYVRTETGSPLRAEGEACFRFTYSGAGTPAPEVFCPRRFVWRSLTFPGGTVPPGYSVLVEQTSVPPGCTGGLAFPQTFNFAPGAFTIIDVRFNCAPPPPPPDFAPAFCNGRRATIRGTTGNDVIQGTNRADVISAGAGSDVITARNGTDLICAGSGNDGVRGGYTQDRGPDKGDRIFGGAGDDVLSGNQGNDTIYGEAGNDGINAGTGRDTCSGGSGRNTFRSCERRI
jgi:extracellular elastinolytic metalloproteinase